MDPLSMTASVIAVITLAATTTKQLADFREDWKRVPDELTSLGNEVSNLRVVLESCRFAFDHSKDRTDMSQLASLLKAKSMVEHAQKLLQELAGLLASCWRPSQNKGARRLKWIKHRDRATRLRQELKTCRDDLNAVLSALSVSMTSFLHLCIDAQWTRHQESQAELIQREAVASQRMKNMELVLQGVAAGQEQIRMALVTNAGAQSMDNTSRQPSIPSKGQAVDTDTLTVRVSARSKYCGPYCRCQCHITRKWRTPAILAGFLGRWSVTYSGIPYMTAQCNDISCGYKQQPRFSVYYYFPRRYLSKALTVSYGKGLLGDPELLLRVPNIISSTAKAFKCLEKNDIGTLKRLFEGGDASPYDETSDGTTYLHCAIGGAAGFRGNINMARFLLANGADPQRANHLGFSAYDLVLHHQTTPRHSRTKLDWYSLGYGWNIENLSLTSLHKILLGFEHRDLEDQVQKSAALINTHDRGGRTPLILASAMGDSSAVTTLLEHGASPTITWRGSSAPIHYAARLCSANAVSALLEHGADPNTPTSKGSTPLHAAVDARTVSVLLAHNANVNARNASQQTPLDSALRRRFVESAEIASILLAHGADPNICARDGMTPLHWAVNRGCQRTVSALLAANANVNASNEFLNSPLYDAVSLGFEDMVSTLLAHGADPRACNDHNETPLHGAIGKRSKSIVSILLTHNADPEARNRDDRTALHEAVRNNFGDAVSILLSHGADPKALTQNNRTLLHEAAWCGSESLVSALLTYGADPNARDDRGETPLHEAASRSSVDIVSILLTHGADPNARNIGGATPLHDAACSATERNVLTLLAHGADPTTCSTSGTTPLHCAAEAMNWKKISILLAKGLDPKAINCVGEIPLHCLLRVMDAPPEVQQIGIEVMTKFIKAGALPEGHDRAAGIAFVIATTLDILEPAQLLREHGVTMDTIDDYGDTALAECVVKNKSNHVAALLNWGADSSIRDDYDRNTIHRAAAEADVQTLAVLTEADISNVDPDALDRYGRTAQEIADTRVNEWPKDDFYFGLYGEVTPRWVPESAEGVREWIDQFSRLMQQIRYSFCIHRTLERQRDTELGEIPEDRDDLDGASAISDEYAHAIEYWDLHLSL